MLSENNRVNYSANQGCQDIRKIYENLDQEAKIILTGFFATLGILGILCNSFVVFCIHKTKQLEIQSIKLFRNFSIIDTFNSIVNFLHLKIILDPQETECMLHYSQRALILWTIYSSVFMVPITAIDRYIHIKYHNNYSSIFSPFRFKIVHVLYFIFVFYQVSISMVITVWKGLYKDLIYTMPLNAIVFIVVVSFYLKSIYLLKLHVNSIELSSSKRNIVKIASRYFYFYLLNMIVLLIHPFITRWIKNSEGADSSALSFNRVIFFVIPTSIAVGNALSFLWINRKCRHLLKSFLCFGRDPSSSTENG